MSTDTIAYEAPQKTGAPTNEFEYRSISKSAVACCVFAVLGLTAYLSQVFVILPLVGIGFGLIALASIRRYPEELLGRTPALVGLIACSVFFVSSIGMHSIIYATEVPEGYQRISFWELRNNKRDTAIPFNKKAYDFDGQRVFLKGYVRPGTGKKIGLKKFILVGDFGDCCFGGNPNTDEVVAIDIVTDDTVNHSYALRRIAGTFRLTPSARPIDEDGIPVVYYTIEADYIR
ncbi:MAG: DUF4190 domain-containing protein [Planctomycetota bacterium]